MVLILAMDWIPQELAAPPV
jgi:hypothetical protein